MGWYEDLFGGLGGDPEKSHQENLEQHYLEEEQKSLDKRKERLGGDGGDDDADVWARGWLKALAGVGVTVVAAPLIYEAYRSSLRGKRAKEASLVTEGLESASARAVTLAAACLPAFGLPIAYITVQALEKEGYITEGLGNAVQTMLAAGAVAPALGGLGNLMASAVRKGK